jgi:hypothetical protein
MAVEKVRQQNGFLAASMSLATFSSLGSAKWWLSEQVLWVG